MRVIGIIAGVILAVLIWQGISFYSSVTDQPDRLEEKAIERAESESVIEKVDEAVQYHGTNSAYVVLKGSDADGDQVYVFVPRKDGALVTKKITNMRPMPLTLVGEGV